MVSKYLKPILVPLIVFWGCRHSSLQKIETVNQTAGETVLLNIIGVYGQEPIQYTTVYSDGRYYNRFLHTGHESSGRIPESIFDKIKQKGLKSRAITHLDGAATYRYDFFNSITEHPYGIGGLLGYIDQEEMKKRQ
ncbi:MAG TPA: hypothetical protein PK054_06215 [Anaerohalosphaeraceae bacterium]|nr:hypothetical protein [Anaerohalosphaeraceae bacterium]